MSYLDEYRNSNFLLSNKWGKEYSIHQIFLILLKKPLNKYNLDSIKNETPYQLFKKYKHINYVIIRKSNVIKKIYYKNNKSSINCYIIYLYKKKHFILVKNISKLNIDENYKIYGSANLFKEIEIKNYARQQHGFDFENFILKLPGFVKSDSYTHKYDGFYNNIPVSIKTCKEGNELCMGDYYRGVTQDKDFILIIGFYSGPYICIKSYFIDVDKWIQNLSYSKMISMKEEMKLITNLKEDDKIWKDFTTKHQKTFSEENTNTIFSLRFKRDHKKQKRIQYAISARNLRRLNFTPFYIDGLDKFYTKQDVVDKILKEIDMEPYDFILEPSAGSGNFVKNLNFKGKILAYDIFPEGDNIEMLDFIQNINLIKEKITSNAIAIGNPPFGKNSSLALKFLNLCMSITYISKIVFILPLTFRKKSIQDKISENFSLEKDIDLDLNAFIYKEQMFNLPCCVQTWIRKKRIVEKNIIIENGYSFVKPDQHYDIQIVRVGCKTSEAFSVEKNISKYNYFIKLNNSENTEHIINKINENRYLLKNIISSTAGPKSLSKSELIPFLNKIIHEYYEKS